MANELVTFLCAISALLVAPMLYAILNRLLERDMDELEEQSH